MGVGGLPVCGMPLGVPNTVLLLPLSLLSTYLPLSNCHPHSPLPCSAVTVPVFDRVEYPAAATSFGGCFGGGDFDNIHMSSGKQGCG